MPTDLSVIIAAIGGPLAIYYYRRTKIEGYLWVGVGMLGLMLEPVYPQRLAGFLFAASSVVTGFGVFFLGREYLKRTRGAKKD
jgi:hypothetical protein